MYQASTSYITIKKLDAPEFTGFTTQAGTTITWTPVANALSYEVTQGQNTFAAPTNTFDAVNQMTVAGAYEFSVKAVGTDANTSTPAGGTIYIDSDSDTDLFYALGKVTNIRAENTINGFNVIWDAAEGAKADTVLQRIH